MNEMDKLKDFIETNRADFDEAYPSLPQGHEARFMRRLEEEKMVAHAWLRCGEMYVTGGNGEGYAIVSKFYK